MSRFEGICNSSFTEWCDFAGAGRHRRWCDAYPTLLAKTRMHHFTMPALPVQRSTLQKVSPANGCFIQGLQRRTEPSIAGVICLRCEAGTHCAEYGMGCRRGRQWRQWGDGDTAVKHRPDWRSQFRQASPHCQIMAASRQHQVRMVVDEPVLGARVLGARAVLEPSSPVCSLHDSVCKRQRRQWWRWRARVRPQPSGDHALPACATLMQCMQSHPSCMRECRRQRNAISSDSMQAAFPQWCTAASSLRECSCEQS